MLEVMTRMAPSQPNEAMAHIAHCPSQSNGFNGEAQSSLIPSQVLWTRFEIALEGSSRFEKGI
jgi:hypothetical protein